MSFLCTTSKKQNLRERFLVPDRMCGKPAAYHYSAAGTVSNFVIPSRARLTHNIPAAQTMKNKHRSRYNTANADPYVTIPPASCSNFILPTPLPNSDVYLPRPYTFITISQLFCSHFQADAFETGRNRRTHSGRHEKGLESAENNTRRTRRFNASASVARL